MPLASALLFANFLARYSLYLRLHNRFTILSTSSRFHTAQRQQLGKNRRPKARDRIPALQNWKTSGATRACVSSCDVSKAHMPLIIQPRIEEAKRCLARVDTRVIDKGDDGCG